LAQRRNARGHREVVRREGRTVAERVLEGIEHPVVHAIGHQHRADGDVTAGQRLRNGDDVWIQAPMFESEQLPGATEARLDFVDREERAVPSTELLRADEVVVGWEVEAVSLDGLDEKDGDVLPAQLFLQRIEIAEGHVCKSGEQRTEATGE